MRRVRILVADNDAKMLQMITEILEAQGKGYSVVQASTPDQAERILSQGQVDLAVLDVKLRDDLDPHDRSGLDVARRHRPFPTIMITIDDNISWKEAKIPGVPMVSKDDRALSGLLLEIRKLLIPHVFIVHGRNHGARDRVARFIQELGMRPRILEEQSTGGVSILQNFEHEAGLADFAVVLLTGDDLCSSDGAEKVRARQNVIFELGYFIARLGSARVVALYERPVEIPSDYSGIIYRELDEGGGWKQRLRDDLSSAGFDPALYARN